MSSNELITNDSFDLGPLSNVPEAEMAKMTEAKFLPYVKLLNFGSKEVEDKKGEAGDWCFFRGKDNMTSLTKKFQALVCGMRSRACHQSATGIDSYYDMNSKEFKFVQEESKKIGHMGDYWGPEFLIYVSQMRAWAAAHLTGEIARDRAGELTTILLNWGKKMEAKSALVKDAISRGDNDALAKAQAITVPNPQVQFDGTVTILKKYNNKKTMTPVFSPISAPFSEVPSFDEIKAQIAKFRNPPTRMKEGVTGSVKAGTGATEQMG